MNILITGCNGQLGTELQLLEKEYPQHTWINTDVKLSDSPDGLPQQQLDITNQLAVNQFVAQNQVDGIINCAAYTAVDKAESDRQMATALNTEAPAYLAAAIEKRGGWMIHISTDYVFNGSGSAPWPADGAALSPLNVYGRSKLAGEKAAAEALNALYTVRTAWLFGVHGGSFVRAMLRLGAAKKELTVVDDQFGSPTYTRDLARLLADMACAEAYGVYHAAGGGGYVSRYAFAEEIFRQAGMPVRLIPAHTADFPGDPVPRPLNGRLELSKLAAKGFIPLPGWKDALSRCLKEMEYHG